MKLPFQNRTEELARLQRRFNSKNSTLVCLYGRRRCGKSRLLQKALEGVSSVYYVGDDREAVLQRRALAKEISRCVEGFDRIEYPGWEELFDHWRKDAPEGAVLAIDELPFLCGASPELPSILQKFVDKAKGKTLHLALCGSSQRMMMGMVLDSTAPLYGRADEILKIEPLSISHLHAVGHFKSPQQTIEAYAVWGGVPRYWELALEYPDTATAIRELVFNPMGILHREPGRLLLNELRDTRQASSILTLIGQGCTRISEIAARIGKPATALSRPISSLIEMGFVRRDIPFGCSPQDSKRTLYRISDPFFDFWYCFVEPNISLLESSREKLVQKIMATQWPVYFGTCWEELARKSIVRLKPDGEEWLPASRWWGKSTEMELDIVSQNATDKSRLLIGKAKLTVTKNELNSIWTALDRKALSCPKTADAKLTKSLFIMNWNDNNSTENVFTAKDIVEAK